MIHDGVGQGPARRAGQDWPVDPSDVEDEGERGVAQDLGTFGGELESVLGGEGGRGGGGGVERGVAGGVVAGWDRVGGRGDDMGFFPEFILG